MKKKLLVMAVTLTMVLSNWTLLYAQEVTEKPEFPVFVSKEGNDSQSGSKESPVKTIKQALKIAQQYKNNKVTVFIEKGDYYENITFDESDKREDDYPLMVQSLENNHVRLIGAEKILSDEAIAVSDSSALNKIPQTAHGNVFQIDLKKQGITEYGELSPVVFGQSSLAPPELFINSSAMILSRWPNDEYARIDSVTEKTDTGFSFTAVDGVERAKCWSQAKDVWAYGFWYWDWANAGFKLKGVNADSGVISTSSKEDVRAGQRFYVYNLLEELDAPGEFYLDRETGILYLYPKSQLKNSDDILLSLSTEPLLKFTNTGNIHIKDIEIGFTRERGISAENCNGLTIENCKIWFTGQLGIQAENTDNLTVRSCTITETGAGGIKNTGGDFTTLTPSNNLFIDNHIYKFSRIIKSYTPAFRIEGVGSTVSNNLIHDEEHIAILYNGNDHVIEYNEIYKVCTSTDDSGAIYTGQRWNDRGNIVRYNYLHDIVGHEGSYGVSGVYLDDIHSSTWVYGNIFYNVSRAVLVGGGRDNIIENNLILEAPKSSTASVVIDSRGLDSWFQPNLNPDTGIVYEHLSKVPYRSEIWKEKYPLLYDMFDNEPKEPRGNIVKNNVIYNHKDLAVSTIVKKYGEVKDNFITDYEDIGFVDYSNKDFHLKEDSVVFDTIPEFQQIPIEKIGLLSKNSLEESMPQALTDAIARHSSDIILLANSNQALIYGKKVSIDTNTDIKIKQVNGNIYLPVRFMAEQLGYSVSFDQDRQAVILKKANEASTLFLYDKLYEKNGETFPLVLAPIIENERTFAGLECLKALLQENTFTSLTGVIVISGDDYVENKKDISIIRAYLAGTL